MWPGWQADLHRLGLLSGPHAAPPGGLPDAAPAPRHGLGSRIPDEATPWHGPSHLPARRLVVLDARHPRVAGAVRPARQPGRAAASPSPSSWLCSTPAPGCSSRSSPRRCAPTRCPRRRDRPSGPAARRRPGGDRGFCSFAHLALLMARGIHGVFRVHQKQIVDFTPDRPHARRGESAAGKGMPRSAGSAGWALLDQRGRMVQAQAEAQVDDRGGVRGAARVAGGA